MCVLVRFSGVDEMHGIGAKVEILNAGFEDSKVLWGKNGRLLMPSELTFCIPGYTYPTVFVRVTWPSGHIQYQLCTESAVTTIEDDSYLIDDSTVSSLYRPGPLGTDWVFEWITNGPTLRSEDFVSISGPSDSSSPCYCGGDTTLDASDTDVDLTITKVASGWKHTLTWHNGCCVVRKPACTFTYEVGSGHSFASDTSANHIFKKMTVCASGI